MYIPQKFKQEETAELVEVIRSHPLATLVMNTTDGLEANHIPLYLEDGDAETLVLRGHVAKANPLWQAVENTAEVLAVFSGVQRYISPNFYATKQVDHKVVPTWNYVAVHARGNFTVIHDASWKLNMLNRLTNAQEESQPKPWQVADAPADYVEKLLNGIVGIEIRVTSLNGKWKTSQNQPDDNKLSVVEHLEKQADDNSLAMAGLVDKSLTLAK